MSEFTNSAANESAYNFLAHRGTHHSCQYGINIQIPTEVANMVSNRSGATIDGMKLAERLNYYCTELIVPATSINSTPIRVGGESIEIPYDRVYGEFQTTFYVDNGIKNDGGLTYAVFQAWFDLIYPPHARTFSYMSDYKTTIEIVLYTYYSKSDSNSVKNYSNQYQNLIKYTLADAWPSSIQGIQQSGRSGTEPSSFIITWKYRYAVSGELDVDGNSNNEFNTSVWNHINQLTKADSSIQRQRAAVQAAAASGKSTSNQTNTTTNSNSRARSWDNLTGWL